jgi:hypothetical protein
VLCLHHDTLAIERRFDGHTDDVVWIEADNSSERGSGKMVASYDNSMMTIIWDAQTGQELARVEPYGDIRVAAWMKNGQIAFGTVTEICIQRYANIAIQEIRKETLPSLTLIQQKTCHNGR